MSDREHSYEIQVAWSGNLGTGTSAYRAYSRDHWIEAPGLARIPGSADLVFRGDPMRYNPEQLLLAALSSCHLLAYLHLCADARVVIVSYQDRARGWMIEGGGAGHFRQVSLYPVVGLADRAQAELALALHERAHAACFIAASVNFPALCEPRLSE